MEAMMKNNDLSRMRFIDYIDVQAITSVLSQNPLLPHLFFSITDTDGVTLASSPWKGVCLEFHRKNKGTRQRCIESDTILARRLKAGENYAIYSCYNNLIDAATPIVVEGELIGHLIIGQVFTQPPDLDFFERQAEMFGFDKKDYIAMIREVPVLEEAKLREIVQFYSGLASMIGTVALQGYKYKELSDKLAARTAELEYTNSELEAFTYSTSHDLRAPLRHITGYIDLFNRKCSNQLNEQGTHYFKAIYDSTRQMGLLIDDLLQFSRNGRVEMMRSEADMDRIVNECMTNLNELKTDRDITYQISGLPQTYGDPDMLRIVWHNLIDNALKFTGKTEKARIEIGCRKEDGKTVYFIKDNGAGFDMKYAGKLFGVFQRLHPKEEYEGTGIGLATVKRIISRHGGRIWAESAPNRGAAFYFTLAGKENEHG